MQIENKIFLGRRRCPRKGRRGTIVVAMTLGMALVSVALIYIMDDVKNERVRAQLTGTALEVATVMKRFDHAIHTARTNPAHRNYAHLRAASLIKTNSIPPITALRFPLSEVRTEMKEETDNSKWYDGDFSIWRIGHGDKEIRLYFYVGDLEDFGFATGVGLLGLSSLSQYEQSFFMQQLLDYKQVGAKKIFTAKNNFLVANLPTDATSRTVILSHWFSDLDENFIFREARARIMPNQMRSDLTLESVLNAANVEVGGRAIGKDVVVTLDVDVENLIKMETVDIRRNITMAGLTFEGPKIMTVAGKILTGGFEVTGKMTSNQLEVNRDYLVDVANSRKVDTDPSISKAVVVEQSATGGEIGSLETSLEAENVDVSIMVILSDLHSPILNITTSLDFVECERC